MKFLKTIFVLAVLFTSLGASAQSPAETISGYARECYSQVRGMVSIGLSQAVHGARPGSAQGRRAKRTLIQFNKRSAAFPLFETGCNESYDGDLKFICYSQNYAVETHRIARSYTAKEIFSAVPECAYLISIRGGEMSSAE